MHTEKDKSGERKQMGLKSGLLLAVLTSLSFVAPALAQWYPNSYYVNPGYNNYGYRGYAPYGGYGGSYYPGGYGHYHSTAHNVAVGAGIGAAVGAGLGLLASHHRHRGYYY